VDGQKERQGDFVFTANDVGEYAFCFDNGMSSISDKTIDFEITVCLGFPAPAFPLHHTTPLPAQITDVSSPFLSGRKQHAPSLPSLQSRRARRTNLEFAGKHLQSLRTAVDDCAEPKVLSDTRESQLQHGAEHGAAHLQIQCGGECGHGGDGGVAGVCGEDVFYEWPEEWGFVGCAEVGEEDGVGCGLGCVVMGWMVLGDV